MHEARVMAMEQGAGYWHTVVVAESGSGIWELPAQARIRLYPGAGIRGNPECLNE